MKLAPSVRRSWVVDAENATYTYVGEAPVGTAESAPHWCIYRLTNSGTASVKEEWADGNSNYDNVWADRASLTYT